MHKAAHFDTKKNFYSTNRYTTMLVHFSSFLL